MARLKEPNVCGATSTVEETGRTRSRERKRRSPEYGVKERKPIGVWGKWGIRLLGQRSRRKVSYKEVKRESIGEIRFVHYAIYVYIHIHTYTSVWNTIYCTRKLWKGSVGGTAKRKHNAVWEKKYIYLLIAARRVHAYIITVFERKILSNSYSFRGKYIYPFQGLEYPREIAFNAVSTKAHLRWICRAVRVAKTPQPLNKYRLWSKRVDKDQER